MAGLCKTIPLHIFYQSFAFCNKVSRLINSLLVYIFFRLQVQMLHYGLLLARLRTWHQEDKILMPKLSAWLMLG